MDQEVQRNTLLKCSTDGGGAGGSQGDLYVFVKVKEHKDLRREGLTVHSDVSVSYVDAILGALTLLTAVMQSI